MRELGAERERRPSTSLLCLRERTNPARSLTLFGKGTKLIYRHYATLYFVIAVDQAESELGILDLVQVFVEVLDKCFENVCELDLIFHSDRVHYILDEIVMGGMVLETNIGDIMEAITEMNALEGKVRGWRARSLALVQALSSSVTVSARWRRGVVWFRFAVGGCPLRTRPAINHHHDSSFPHPFLLHRRARPLLRHERAP